MYDPPRGTHRLLYEGWQRSCQCNGLCVRGSAYLQRYILLHGDSAVMSVVSEHLQKMNGKFIDRLFSRREPHSLLHARIAGLTRGWSKFWIPKKVAKFTERCDLIGICRDELNTFVCS